MNARRLSALSRPWAPAPTATGLHHGWRLFRPAVALYLLLAAAGQASAATRLEIPTSFNPVGSGARALGMGGAFISVADDATAASWNPGGLVQLRKPELSVVLDGLARCEDNRFDPHPEADHQGRARSTRMNYLSAAYPFTAPGHNMIVSLNHQNLYEFGRTWDFRLDTRNESLQAGDHHHYTQDGALYALGLAYGIQVSRALALGITLNRWDDLLAPSGWTQEYHVSGSGTLDGLPYQLDSDKRERFDFSGTNFNLGLRWRITPQFSLGAVLKTPFDARLVHTTTESFSQSFTAGPDGDSTRSSLTSRTTETLRMPLSYGIGLAWRPLRRPAAGDPYRTDVTVAVDLYRTEWSRFALVGADGVERSPLSGRPLSEVAGIGDTLWVRAGVEWLLDRDDFTVALRGGLFYDPAPAEGGSDDYYGFTLGTGVAWDWIVFDIAYQYRVGTDVGSDALPQVGLSQDVTEHRLYTSLILHL